MIALRESDRFRHLYISGKTQSGKTTMMLRLIRQDLLAGSGVALITPHGDPAKLALRLVPESRIKDVYYFEPKNYPLGLNPLSGNANDLIFMFRRILSDSWGPRMASLLRYSIHALQETGGTFLDIHTLIRSKKKQTQVISQLSPQLKDYWLHRFPDIPSNTKEAILDRLDEFALDPVLRTIFGARKSLNFRALIDGRKILIANLGGLPRTTVTLLGSILVSGLERAALSRDDIPKSQRVPFYLSIDEFQYFQGPEVVEITNESAKFRLALTFASPSPSQLPRDIQSSINDVIAFRIHCTKKGTQYFFQVNGHEHTVPALTPTGRPTTTQAPTLHPTKPLLSDADHTKAILDIAKIRIPIPIEEPEEDEEVKPSKPPNKL